MMVKDEWVQAAINDDNVVVELLVRLKQAQAAPSAPKSALPALKWGIRHRRSRPMLLRCYAKRDGGSPTTPLCWSGGSSDASTSAADVFEETGTHLLLSPPIAPSRSKGSSSSETYRTSTKCSRRNKTFAGLEEEDNLLLKERVRLEKEIASTRATRKEHRAMNESSKRIRLGLNSSLTDDEPEMAPCPRAPSSLDSTFDDNDDRERVLDSHNVGKSIFVLPDLNMMPGEEDSGPEN